MLAALSRVSHRFLRTLCTRFLLRQIPRDRDVGEARPSVLRPTHVALSTAVANYVRTYWRSEVS